VLIIVLWISFGLVSLTLYFAHTMSFELRASDNRVAAIEAEQAITGAARYVSNVIVTATIDYPGTIPDPTTYLCESVPVGNATFWLIGRGDWQSAPDLPYFNLVDEASKLNLNTATLEMLEMLPWMTPELAAAIIDWRDADSEVTTDGAEDDTYQRLNPPYRCKNARFESVDELRMVYGMDLEILYGEDTNLNGVLDPNENDGDASPPSDNRDGRLDCGLLEYVTVFSREVNLRTNGSPRINVAGTNQQELATLLQEKLGTDRANQVLQTIGYTPASSGGAPAGGGAPGGAAPGGGGAPGGATASPVASVTSVLEFYLLSGMTADELALIATDITASSSNVVEGLINVNTASEVVLACIPGIGEEQASSLVAYRQNNPSKLTSVAWVADALGQTNAIQAGPYITANSYQFTADIAAVGHYNRGYRRVKFVLDMSDGTPKIVYRQDLTHLGWALGQETRRSLELARQTR
jgi:type II secretory pathway component PulK